jgi:hypothetical protein
VQFFDSDVAQSVDYATRSRCDVVSMSLGGKGFFGLKKAIRRALDVGMIVMAAAGNKVRVVTAPASYDNCIAVAGVGVGNRLWQGSSRGRAVDVAAPAECVHVAAFDWEVDPPGHLVDRSHGTSFAVAYLAGVAAIWLAFHGRDNLLAKYGAPRIQSVFLHLLETRGTRRPTPWNDGWGCGVVDANLLLQAPLPDPQAVPVRVSAFRPGAYSDTVTRISSMLSDLEPHLVEQRLETMFGSSEVAQAQTLPRYEGELLYLLLEDRDFRERFIAGWDSGALGNEEIRSALPSSATEELRAAVLSQPK